MSVMIKCILNTRNKKKTNKIYIIYINHYDNCHLFKRQTEQG